MNEIKNKLAYPFYTDGVMVYARDEEVGTIDNVYGILIELVEHKVYVHLPSWIIGLN